MDKPAEPVLIVGISDHDCKSLSNSEHLGHNIESISEEYGLWYVCGGGGAISEYFGPIEFCPLCGIELKKIEAGN